MSINDFYAWVENNPDKAKKIFTVYGSSDMIYVYSRLYLLGASSIDEAYSTLMISKRYPFKRDFVKPLKQTLLANTITFLAGPRKCGKTVALRQLVSEIPDSKYVSVKTLSAEAKNDLLSEVENAICHNLSQTYFIDEFTYFNIPDIVLANWGTMLSEFDNNNTHIVITGSQSRALIYWARINFAGTCGTIVVDFMSYGEWLRYKGLECNAESYMNFICNIDKFYAMSDPLAYLTGCLDETVVSNSKSSGIIRDNDVTDLDVNLLLDVLFSSLVCLHDNASFDTFRKQSELYEKMGYFYRSDVQADSSVVDRINDLVKTRYQSYRTINAYTLYTAVRFLYNCGLITLTPILDHLETLNVLSLLDPSNCKKGRYADYLFEHVNISIRHPAFFVALIKYALGVSDLQTIPSNLLGSIVECHARGVLDSHSCLEYHDVNNHDAEIDYVNIGRQIAIELTISRKHKCNFKLLPPEYEKIMMSRSNYFQYILNWENERGAILKDLV